MRISHDDSIRLEHIVRKVFMCGRYGMSGFIDADHFESEPFDAALIALSRLWKENYNEDIEDFLNKWSEIRLSNDRNIDVKSYINELNDLISSLK